MTTWDEAFAERYDEWSAEMKADVAFNVELAREAGEGAIVDFDHPLAAEADGRRGDRPVPHTTRFFVPDNRMENHARRHKEPLGDESREYVFVTRLRDTPANERGAR